MTNLEVKPMNLQVPAAYCFRPDLSLRELFPSNVTSGALAQSCHSWSSCPVESLLELLPSRVNPGSLPGEFLSSRGELHSPSRVTLVALAQSCHFLSSRPVMSLLELLPSHVTPGALAQ